MALTDVNTYMRSIHIKSTALIIAIRGDVWGAFQVLEQQVPHTWEREGEIVVGDFTEELWMQNVQTFDVL